MFELQKKQVLDRGGQASQCRRHKPPVSFRSKLCLISLLLHGSPWWFKQLRIRPQLGRPGFDPWVGKIPWRREQLPTLVFWLENSMDCIVHGVAKSQTRLSDFCFTLVA